MEYNANFLWGHDDNSIESLGYEFANAKTEEYQKECWEALKQAIKISCNPVLSEVSPPSDKYPNDMRMDYGK